jgi:hypothetical protein
VSEHPTRHSQAPSESPSTRPTGESSADELLARAIETPIAFWGKVVDEEGNPVPSATVAYSVGDQPFPAQFPGDNDTKYADTSDSSGLFSLEGVKGATLFVRVSKKGFQARSEEARRLFVYGYPSEQVLPAANNPAVFVLRKTGETEPLIYSRYGGLRLPKNGDPVLARFPRGRPVAPDLSHIEVQMWTDDEQLDEQGRYPWRFRISVPGGGLSARKDEFDFVAPSEGYQSSIEVSMEPTEARWSNAFEADYFIKLGNGTYARANFLFVSSGEHFLTLTSYVNPRVGSRNLEFDKAKQIE